MTEIAKAYVQIVPSMQGFGDTVRSAVQGEADSAGTKSGKSFGGMFKSAAMGGIKMVGAGIAAAGAAAVAIAKNSLEAYADYEQLVGGVETMFKENSDLMLSYAKDSYKTAGISANEYMETVTGFSAAMIKSLGGNTAEAAKLADTAITDMADNANKMGTSMESIQNAYQGFAKQNYTMLDNLKLGYGGTKEEMQRLIDDANKIRESQGINTKLSIDSFADITTAIHEVQTEMGITGTTAKEAGSTISGSVNTMKAAWQNLLVGIADDSADFDSLINNFVDSVVVAGENIIPRVQTIIGGLGKLITAASDKLVPMVVDTIVTNLPSIVESGVNLIVTLAGALVQAIPQLLAAIPQIIMAIVNGVVAGWPQIQQAGREVVDQFGNAIRGLAGSAWNWGSDLMSNFINGIRAWFGNLMATVSNVASVVRSYIHFSEPDRGPLADFHTYAPDMMKEFAQGIYENSDLVADAMSSVAGAASAQIGGLDVSPWAGSAAGVRPAGNQGETAFRTDVNVSFRGSLSQLAMVLQPYIEAETTRLGTSLALA